MYVVPLLTAAVVTYQWRRIAAHVARDRLRLEARRQFLPRAVDMAMARAVAAPDVAQRELTEAQLGIARYALDRALQPIGDLNGYDHRDQFQTAALRYQINHLGFSLALLQCHYTPSFQGYLGQAQRNLIEQYLQRRIWNYWIYETAWGHLNLTNFDPANRDNIMLTGWLGLHVNLYMIASGDRRYGDLGSLTFRLNERTAYPHDTHSLARSVAENFERAKFCLYPCEPNWIYPICNHYGMTSLVAHDTLFGTNTPTRTSSIGYNGSTTNSPMRKARSSACAPNSPVGYRRFRRVSSVTRTSHTHSRPSARGGCGRSPAPNSSRSCATSMARTCSYSPATASISATTAAAMCRATRHACCAREFGDADFAAAAARGLDRAAA